MSVRRILVVDDDPLSREFMTEAVQSLGYLALAAPNGNEALERIADGSPDMVISDLRMPGMDGIELCRRITAQGNDLPVVVVTAHGTIETAVEAMQEGARDFVLKPVSPDALRIAIERVEHTRRLEQENAYLRQEVSGANDPVMIAESEEMVDLLRSAARISRSRGTVLITGESGTGKERVAQYIHQASTCLLYTSDAADE